MNFYEKFMYREYQSDFIVCDTVLKNGRIYPSEIVISAINAAQRLIKNKSLFLSIDKRLLDGRIDMSKIVGRVKDLSYSDFHKKGFCTAELDGNLPLGQNALLLMELGKYCFSTLMFGSFEADGCTIKEMDIVGISMIAKSERTF